MSLEKTFVLHADAAAHEEALAKKPVVLSPDDIWFNSHFAVDAPAKNKRCSFANCPNWNKECQLPARCKHCRAARYCSSKCRKLAADTHKIACKGVADEAWLLLHGLVNSTALQPVMKYAEDVTDASIAASLLHLRFLADGKEFFQLNPNEGEDQETFERRLSVALLDRIKSAFFKVRSGTFDKAATEVPAAPVPVPLELADAEAASVDAALPETTELPVPAPEPVLPGAAPTPAPAAPASPVVTKLPQLRPGTTSPLAGLYAFASIAVLGLGGPNAAIHVAALLTNMHMAASNSPPRGFSFFSLETGTMAVQYAPGLEPRELFRRDVDNGGAHSSCLYLVYLTPVEVGAGIPLTFVLWRIGDRSLLLGALPYVQSLGDRLLHSEEALDCVDSYAGKDMPTDTVLDSFWPDVMQLTEETVSARDRERAFCRAFGVHARDFKAAYFTERAELPVYSLLVARAFMY